MQQLLLQVVVLVVAALLLQAQHGFQQSLLLLLLLQVQHSGALDATAGLAWLHPLLAAPSLLQSEHRLPLGLLCCAATTADQWGCAIVMLRWLLLQVMVKVLVEGVLLQAESGLQELVLLLLLVLLHGALAGVMAVLQGLEQN